MIEEFLPALAVASKGAEGSGGQFNVGIAIPELSPSLVSSTSPLAAAAVARRIISRKLTLRKEDLSGPSSRDCNNRVEKHWHWA